MLLQYARQCAALTTVARERGDDGARGGDIESEISILALDRVSKIYQALLHSTAANPAETQAFAISGKLQATLECICELNEKEERILEIADDAARDAIWNRLCWLNNAADDLARSLVPFLSVDSAGGGL